jgi:glycosyltransferase involved in cell wall biosynthesis
MNFINIGTYSPKQCGIATFSKDLRDSLTRLGERTAIAAVSDPYFNYTYPDEVSYVIRQTKLEDYANTANKINRNTGLDCVIIQHEYGIYGGADGDYLLEFTVRLKKPFLLVTHTILPNPTANQKSVLSALCRQAAVVVCMTRISSSMLSSVYGAEPEKVYIIHHGVPAFKIQDRNLLKEEYGYERRELITTFGLIGPGKGIEIGIRALKRLVMKHKNLMYLIVGRTHPMLVEHEGEGHGDHYRKTLVELVHRLGMQDHVEFVNEFLEPEELGEYLYMTDIYLSPYPDLNQAISGTLAYALGCGRAIVSTPYLYALEMLSEGQRGLVTLDATAESLAELLDRVLSQPDLKLQLEKRAALLGAKVKWPHIARQYADLAESVLKAEIAI